MNKNEAELFSEKLAIIQSDVTDRVVSLADDFGMDRDRAFFIILSGFDKLYKNFTLREYIPRNKE